LPWRPFYLQRRILFSFAAVFALLIIAIETLHAVSNANNGIVSASSNQHYLWTYGPTAILTLIAAVWSRAEYQSKLVAPWIRLASPAGVHPKHTLLLDYLSDFQLYAVFKALRNRDFTVSITTTVAIVIKALVVISTGLITLSWTKTSHQSWPMTIQDRFVDNNTRLSNTDSLSYYVMQGLINRNLTDPNGISSEYAFQSVGADHLPDDAETLVTVDGFQGSLECEPAELILRSSEPSFPRFSDGWLNVTVTSPGCNLQDLMISPAPRWCYGGGDSCNVLLARFALTQCDGTMGDSGKRVLVMSGNMTYAFDYSRPREGGSMGVLGDYAYTAQLHHSVQMLCVPTYGITKVEVLRNGTQTKTVRASPGAARWSLASVTAWDMMKAHYAALQSSVLPGFSPHGTFPEARVSETVVDVDEAMELALPLQLPPDSSLLPLFEFDSLQQLATGYYRKFAAIIAKQSLMGLTSVETQGFVVTWEDRLVIRDWAAQWMAGLAAACVLLTALAGFLVPRRGILPCSPTTLPGIAFLVAHSRDLLEMLRFSGAADAKSLGRPLLTSTFRSGAVVDPMSGSRHFAILSEQDLLHGRSLTFPQVSSKHTHPGVLHPGSRLTLCLLLAGLITTLELTLRKSDHDRGLGDVGDDTYIHYTWTAVPAVVFGALSMMFSSMDFSIRSLAPYNALKQGVTGKKYQSLDFMNMSIPRTIFHEIKSANIGAVAATAAFLVASVFTIFSASLFQPLAIPTTIPVTLRSNESFYMNPGRVSADAIAIASLIFGSNFSYPMFTYGNLAFPQLVPTPPLPIGSSVNASTVSIDAVVPAIRSKLDCRVYDSSKIRTNLTLNYSYIMYDNPLEIYIEGEDCVPGREPWNHILTTRPNMTYFALSDSGEDTVPDIEACSDQLYTWGKLDYTADPIVQYVAAVGCNETVETLSVSTAFVGTSLSIDTQRPPQPLENTTQPSTMKPGGSLYYSYLSGIPTAPDYLQPFFAFLISSPWAIPLASLGDPSATDTVVQAIKKHNGIIQAQHFAQTLREANQTTTTLTPAMLQANPNATDDMPLYSGTATTPEGEGTRRVVQDRTSTRILQALLGCVMLLVVVGWAFMRQTDVLPRTPTTIASVVALLAGGNLFEVAQMRGGGGSNEGRDEKVWEELKGGGDGGGEGNWGRRGSKGVRFWMGWGTVTDWEGREIGGGDNEGGLSRLGIFVLQVEGKENVR
jgi:hypothetical protein